MNDIYQLYKELSLKEKLNLDTYLVEKIPNHNRHRLGVSETGLPLFFIQTELTNELTIDINLKLIQVSYVKNCQLISTSGEKINGVYTIVSLKSDSEDIIRYFITTMHYLIMQLGDKTSFSTIKSELANLINLFKSLSNPSKNTIQGLWTELLFISQSNNPEYLIQAWHLNKKDRFDFNDGQSKVEIKSTSRTERIHTFSLSQLTEIEQNDIYIGSTFTIETGSGKCANDLIELIKGRVANPESLLKVHNIVGETMGDKIERIYDVFFDYNLALNSILYFNTSDIPTIQSDQIPPEVSNVKFDCNLSNIRSVEGLAITPPLLKAFWNNV